MTIDFITRDELDKMIPVLTDQIRAEILKELKTVPKIDKPVSIKRAIEIIKQHNPHIPCSPGTLSNWYSADRRTRDKNFMGGKPLIVPIEYIKWWEEKKS